MRTFEVRRGGKVIVDDHAKPVWAERDQPEVPFPLYCFAHPSVKRITLPRFGQREDEPQGACSPSVLVRLLVVDAPSPPR